MSITTSRKLAARRRPAYRRPAPKIPVPDQIKVTPELVAFAAKYGYRDMDALAHLVEAWRLKRRRDHVEYEDEQQIADDLMYFITNCASNRDQQKERNYA